MNVLKEAQTTVPVKKTNLIKMGGGNESWGQNNDEF